MNLRLGDDWPRLGRADGVGGQEKMDTGEDTFIYQKDRKSGGERSN